MSEFTERWRPTPGLRSYEVSDRGRVRRSLPGRGTRVGRVLSSFLLSGRYPAVTLMRDDGSWGPYSVHRLVCWAFHGPPPSDRHHAAHRDGNALNNTASNLRWASPKENEADKELHGTRRLGSEHANAILDEVTVLDVVKRISTGETQHAVARHLGVSPSAISAIWNGTNWSHLTGRGS